MIKKNKTKPLCYYCFISSLPASFSRTTTIWGFVVFCPSTRSLRSEYDFRNRRARNNMPTTARNTSYNNNNNNLDRAEERWYTTYILYTTDNGRTRKTIKHGPLYYSIHYNGHVARGAPQLNLLNRKNLRNELPRYSPVLGETRADRRKYYFRFIITNFRFIITWIV